MSLGPECHKFSWDNHAKNITLVNTTGLRRGANPTASTFTFQRSLVLLCIPSIFETCLSTSCRSENNSHPFTTYRKPHIQRETSHLSSPATPGKHPLAYATSEKCQFSRFSPCLCAHVEVGVVSVPAPLPNVASHTFQQKGTK